jgi:hypothetical protein
MKRFVAFLGLMAVILALSIGCEFLEGVNKIDYPAELVTYEVPGDPITLELAFEFFDQTPDSSGVNLSLDRQNGNLIILLEGTKEGSEEQGGFSNLFTLNLGEITLPEFTIYFQDGKDNEEDVSFFYGDSSYYYDDVEAGWPDKIVFIDTFQNNGRRLFADMLLVETGYASGQEDLITTLKEEVLGLGAVEVALEQGSYSIFKIESEGEVTGHRENSPEWKTAGFDATESMIFTYDGDTTLLDDLYTSYADTITLSIRMGSGFDRYNWE